MFGRRLELELGLEFRHALGERGSGLTGRCRLRASCRTGRSERVPNTQVLTQRNSGELQSRASLIQSITKKNTGVRKIPKRVTPSMPLKTVVPRVRRISAPAPWPSISGSTPRMNASDVITIGRSRSRHASSVAWRRDSPASRWYLANSTIRIAFLLASPTSTTKPIWVKMLMSSPAILTPRIALKRHIGTTRITASGSDQLSYCAASTRNTITTAKPKMYIAVFPACRSK